MSETERSGESKSWADFIDSPPKIRADCQDLPRPCLWTTCKFHLRPLMMKDDNWKKLTDEEKIEFLYSMEETCALDVAEDGAKSSEEIKMLLHYKYSRPIDSLLSLIFRKLRTSRKLVEINNFMLEERSLNWS